MAREKSPHLTDAELRLMDVSWEKGQATVSDVAEALPNNPALAYSTVLTTLRILENKGFVRHTKNGRAFVYHPVVGRAVSDRTLIDAVHSSVKINTDGEKAHVLIAIASRSNGKSSPDFSQTL